MHTYRVGLTGGIGSGKTAVSDLFAQRGVTVVDADLVARAVVRAPSAACDAIVQRFGTEVLQADGQLDRAKLRARVFADKGARQWLEALTHPLIGTEMHRQVREAASAYVLVVVPLLLETQQQARYQHIVVVDVSPATQIARAGARDHADAAHIARIMQQQVSRAERLRQADSVINNDGTLAALTPQVDALHTRFMRDATAHGAG